MRQRQFQSTPPARGATSHSVAVCCTSGISIHAPREGGDVYDGYTKIIGVISIHAPREGGDKQGIVVIKVAFYFNPRPPRGGRRDVLPEMMMELAISIHAPREGGDGDS